jgi:EAL domain-containing protein (putative c-di-GMP-specific phosphodiesterase class I)
MPHAEDDSAITSAIIAMAHSLRLEVVAEGVETNEQLKYLNMRHCDYAQGYLISRPVPAAALAHFVRDRLAAKATAS